MEVKVLVSIKPKYKCVICVMVLQYLHKVFKSSSC